MLEAQYLSVKALTKYIKRKFDYDPHLQNIYVKGEISNYKKHSSGHMYFTLKDEEARIMAVMFASRASKLPFELENGMHVLINGEITIYEPSGQYQIYVNTMQPDGIGSLHLAFEQLKEKLGKEGLFHEKHKKSLPSYPEAIGVITSPTGAAVRDIITTIKRRYPIAKIIIYPALVQGRDAAVTIANAISIANKRNEVDVLIVGRGGGSIEELWAFNEEVVARAIFESTLPVISAVGHETDTTIADFVADLRAPTPTGAAELAVPHIEDLLEKILNQKIRLIRIIKERVKVERERLTRIEKSYAFRYPKRLYEQKLEQLDKISERSYRAIHDIFAANIKDFNHLTKRLERNHPNEKFIQAKDQFGKEIKSLNRQMSSILKTKQTEFSSILNMVEALNPLKIMERGYSIIFKENEEIVKSISDVTIDDELQISLYDGTIVAQVKERKGKEKID